MFAVIFEVEPKQERWDDYLALAKQLRPKLEAIDGFIDNERFASKRREGRLLSLSTWRDEKSVIRWRTEGEHHAAQEKGRFEVFRDYHLRVGEITADSVPPPGLRVEETRFDETEIGAAKMVTITELTRAKGDDPGAGPEQLAAQFGLDAGHEALVDHDVFESIYRPGKRLLLASWRDAASAAAWNPKRPDVGAAALRHRRVRVVRDYGMFERREAPQFYPEVRRAKSQPA